MLFKVPSTLRHQNQSHCQWEREKPGIIIKKKKSQNSMSRMLDNIEGTGSYTSVYSGLTYLMERLCFQLLTALPN